MTVRHCGFCGTPLGERDLDVRFGLPDPVLRLDSAEQDRYRKGPDILPVSGVGVFARVLLQVSMTDGYRIRFGTWLGLFDRAVFDEAVRLWHDPAYPELVLEGRLANEIEPWGNLLGAPARAVVRQAHEVPYVDIVTDHPIMTQEWPRDWVMAAFEDDFWSAPCSCGRSHSSTAGSALEGG